MANATTLQLGAWSPLTDTFVAHPNSPTNAIYNLNDQANWTIVDAQEGFGTGLEITPPRPEVLKVGNSRAVGERVTRRNYSHNRTIRVNLLQLPQTTQAAWNANLRNLIQLCEGISQQQPAALQIQLTSSSTPTYADIVEAHVSTRYKETLFQQYVNDEVTLELECRPFLRGPRQTLSNLIVNPGFEAPNGPGVTVFNDTCTNTDAYTLVAGIAPTIIPTNVLQIAQSTIVTFGSPVWGPIQRWRLRFQGYSAMAAAFHLHRTDGNNLLRALISGSTVQLQQAVATVTHNLGSAITFAQTTSTWYWMEFTQFPTAPGTPPIIQITFYNDSSGAIGAQIVTSGPVATYDGVTALTGYPAIETQSGTSLNIGGNYSNVHFVNLFGPGGWGFGSTIVADGAASGAWEQNTANTYGGGAVTSYGAARIDLPPAGAVNAFWDSYNSLDTTTLMPVSSGQVIAASAYSKSTGLAATTTISLVVQEWNASAGFLRSTTLQSVTGNQATWTKLSGAVTLGASTAFCSVQLNVMDSTAAASANGTVWFDNAQCWNITTTGQTSMPYCELRFQQSPAQLLVTGILGDVPAPALMSVGAYFSSIPQGTTLSLRVGQRAIPTRGFVGIAYPIVIGTVASGGVTFASATLGASYYGGALFTNNINVNTSYAAQITWTPPSTDDQQIGVYHLFARVSNSNTSANVALMTVRAEIFQKLGVAGTALLAAYYGTYLNAGLKTQNLLTISDTGQLQIPASAFGALTDLSQLASLLDAQFSDPTSSTTTFSADYLMLLPIDGAYLAATINNPSNASVQNAVWLWVYNDGTQTQQALTPAWRYSLESSGIPAPAHGVGITGTQSTGYLNINPAAQPSLSLDPRPNLNGVSGVAQLVAQWNDQNAAILPLAAEFVYSPLYLWPL